MPRPGEAVSKNRLAGYLDAHDDGQDCNLIVVRTGSSRKKLDLDGKLKPIETLRNRGYRFTLCETKS